MVSRVRGRVSEPSGTGIKSVNVLVERKWAQTDENGEIRELPFAENTIVVHGLGTQMNETGIHAAFGRYDSLLPPPVLKIQ